MAAAEVVERRLVRPAHVLGERTAIGERAAGGDRAEPRQEARDRVEMALVLARPAARHATQQCDGVRMPRVAEHRLDRALLHQAAGIEHADALAHLRHDGEVVGDEEHRRAELRLQVGDQLEHLGLDGRVEAGGRLVEDQELGIGGERHRDDDALLHPAGQLVRVALQHGDRIGDLDALERLARALPRLRPRRAPDREDLCDLVADADRRIERRARVLVHHRDDVRAELAQPLAREPEHVTAADLDRAAPHPAVARQVPDRRERDRRLAAAGLADEAVGLAAPDRARHARDDLPVAAADAVGDIQVAELECVAALRPSFLERPL